MGVVQLLLEVADGVLVRPFRSLRILGGLDGRTDRALRGGERVTPVALGPLPCLAGPFGPFAFRLLPFGPPSLGRVLPWGGGRLPWGGGRAGPFGALGAWRGLAPRPPR